MLANLVVAPLACCILGAALGALVLGSLPYVGTGIIWVLIQVTTLLNVSMEFVCSLAGSQLTAIHVSGFQAFLLFLLLGTGLSYLCRRTSFRLLTLLGVANLLLISGIWMYACPFSDRFYLYRSEVYHRKRFEAEALSSDNGFYQIDSLRIAVLKDAVWKDKESSIRLKVDYAYICRGFRGNVEDLLRVFEIRQVVFDASLNPVYRSYLSEECRRLQIPFTGTSLEGSYQIFRQN